MNARLLIVEPQKAGGIPIESPLLVEENGSLVLYTSDWAACVVGATLETATTDDLRDPLRLRAGEQPFLHLSAVRELPDADFTSPEQLRFVRHWWAEEVLALLRAGRLADAPALTSLVSN